MKRRRTIGIIILMMLLCMGSPLFAATVADHNSAGNFGAISADSFSSIRSTFNIYYGHTSHGSQIITGLSMLENEDPGTYARPAIYEDGWIDLGDPDWEPLTRDYLDNHPETNLVMWSWCGQLSWYSDGEVNDYLNTMSQLEADYPNVIFVYMTGHLDGTGPSGTLYVNNNRIRAFCSAHNKVVFDFADIESYDPDGNYYPDGSDWCEWCSTWCASHSCPGCSDCAHSQCFNCYLKGKAFWWLLSQLVGSVVISSEDDSGSSGCFIATAAYGSPLEDHVKVLCDFRDRYLLTNKPGKKFVELYYMLSPPIAEFIKKHDSLKASVRLGLTPFVLFCYLGLGNKGRYLEGL